MSYNDCENCNNVGHNNGRWERQASRNNENHDVILLLNYDRDHLRFMVNGLAGQLAPSTSLPIMSSVPSPNDNGDADMFLCPMTNKMYFQYNLELDNPLL